MPPNNPSKNILIIEDDQDILNLLQALFLEEGYEITGANNGQTALEFLRSVPTLPRVILLDLTMPVMDGFVFREAQRSNARIANIPVILMTAAGDPQGKAKEIGAVTILKKPFASIDSILQTVHGVLAVS